MKEVKGLRKKHIDTDNSVVITREKKVLGVVEMVKIGKMGMERFCWGQWEHDAVCRQCFVQLHT